MTTRSLTWSASHKYGTNSLAHQFPSFQINAADARRGAVKVEATSPSGRTQEMAIGENNGVYTANFTPTEVGDWLISILYEGAHIQGSPFNVRVYDAAQVKVFGLEGGAVGKMFSFSVDTAGAGDGELRVDITREGQPVPVQVYPEGRGMYRATFTPKGGGLYTIRVYFAGMEVTGSPYSLEIVDSSMVTASGDGLSSVEVNRKSVFVVNTGHGGAGGDIKVNIKSPRGAQIPCNVINNGDGTYNIEYTAGEVGEYVIDVFYYGKPITGSPFRVQAFDWNRINIQNLQSSGTIGRMVEFDIDAQHAGSGNLEIMVNDGTIPCSVQNRGNRQFHATFMPKEPIPHFIQMRFNGREVPGSPWKVDMRSAAHVTVAGAGVGLVPVNRSSIVDVRTGVTGGYEGAVIANITSPTRRMVSSQVMNSGAGVHTIHYTPTEVGNYVLDITYDGMPVPGGPFTSKAYDCSGIVVGQLGSGVAGKPVEFTIDVTQAGEGQLEIMVNRGAVPNTVKMLRKGVFLVTFVPRDAKNHVVDIKFNGELYNRCPITVPILDASRVTVQGDGIHQVAVNRSSFFKVNTASAGAADLSVRVTSPNGDQVPAKIVQQPDGDYKVEYSSTYTGRHTVEILYANQAIMGSPFYVEIYDPNKIRVEGSRSGNVGQLMEFEIIRNEAGKAELGLNITSPSGNPVQYQIMPTKLGDRVTYTPYEPGPHLIYITYGGLEVPGCPITQTILDSSTASAYGDGLYKGLEDIPATFVVDSRGQRGDLSIEVEGPNSLAKCRKEPNGQGQYTITYTPVEVGTYTVHVRWNGRDIEGSPFQPKVVDPRKVRVIGGWESIVDANNKMSLVVGREKTIQFDGSLAGPGAMSAEVRGPNGLVPSHVEHMGTTQILTFTPSMVGEHFLNLYWAENLLPKSPITGMAAGGIPAVNHEKVVLTGRGLKEAIVRHEAEFVIDGTEAGPGAPQVTLTGVKQDIDVQVVALGGDKYRATYTPHIAGAYLLNIMWSDRQVRGSPFKVNVIAHSDASKVVCSGEGLKSGILGKEIKSIIDTRRAGPGELTAHCMGPTKVAFCELYDHRDGTFALNVRPQEAGRHVLQIKYGGEHVPGSPYVLRISGAPDASKVRVSGPGIEHGILATYQSRFIVETRGAGAGQLTVRIRGPKGAFRVEMQRESQKDRTILCRYDPTEVGDYILSIKWSGVDVPGSPFHIQIFDTQDELERFLAENPSRRTNAPVYPPRSDGGWEEDI